MRVQMVVVLLEPLQDGGPPGDKAAAVLQEVISICETRLPDKMKTLPPLPRYYPDGTLQLTSVPSNAQCPRELVRKFKLSEHMLQNCVDPE